MSSWKLILLTFGAAALLIVSCLMDWVYYPELKAYFSGYYSKDNIYGKPWKLFTILASLMCVLTLFRGSFIIVYAKIFTGILIVVYAVKNFVDFSQARSFTLFPPERQMGLYIMVFSSFILCFLAFVRKYGDP